MVYNQLLMSKGKTLMHPITSQLEYQYILGPIKIKDGLFIGDQFAAKDIEFIHTNKVSHVINTVARRIPNIWEKVGVQYLCFNWTETDWNIFDKKNTVINSIFAFIEEAMDLGECCLIHSMNAKSRSFLVVAAYLMKKYSWSLDKIFSFVNSKKPGIEVKGVYMKQLKELEEKMNKIHAFSSTWDDAKNQDDLILKNTYINSFPIQFSEVYKPGKQAIKKVSWQESDSKINRFKQQRKKMIYDSVKDTKKEESQQIVIKSILKSTTKTKQREKQEEPASIINNINGNIIHVTVNNFITPDDETKTATKASNPLMTRPYSSDTKDKKKDLTIKDKLGTYESFLNFKSPYESKLPGQRQKPKRPGFSSKIGMNDTFKKSNDNFKQTYERPLSAANPDKKKLNNNKPITVVNPLIKDLVVTNTKKPLIGGRYPSPMVKDNGSTINQLRERWRRDI